MSRDPRFAGWLVRTLRDVGWTIRAAATPTAALAILDEWDPALVVTDEPRPNLQGPWIDAARRASSGLVVVAPRWIEGELEGALGAGADGYICCPVGDHELVARLRAIARRIPAGVRPSVRTTPVARFGPLQLDLVTGELGVGDSTLHLPRREAEILEALLVVAPNVVARDDLIRALRSVDPAPVHLDVVVRRLRGRLEATEGWRRIDTVRGVGFRLLDRRPAFTDASIDGHASFDLNRERVSP